MSLPPSEIPQGAIRFNTDSQKLEFYAQGEWWVMSTDTPNLGQGSDSTPGARGVYIEGQAFPAGDLSGIEYINIATTGTREDFGSLSVTDGGGNQPMSDKTRAVFSGENPAGPDIEYVTISSTGNATDWGTNLNRSTYYGFGISNATRGVQAGSFNGGDNTGMDYVTIQSAGTVTDFGDLGTGASHGASVMSPTRGVFCGGYYTGPNQTNKMQFVTTASTGGTQDFGNLSAEAWNSAGACSATRGIIALGTTPGVSSTAIEYITLSSTGNSTNFGEMSNQAAHTHHGGGCCSPTRGVIMGGYDGSYKNYMSMINISTQGDAVDWGTTLAGGRINTVGCSNAHGGL
jgi:hypothetical protein